MTDNNYYLDLDDDFLADYRNKSHHLPQQSVSGQSDYIIIYRLGKHLPFFLSAPSKPGKLEANMTGPYSVRLKWTKPKRANGIIVIFKVRMFWRFKNRKGGYKYDTYIIPAKVTNKRRKRKLARETSDNIVWRLDPFRDIELKKIQPFAIISVRVSEATRDDDKEPMWSPFSSNQTIETKEGGKRT